ncbi:hypothetical protein CRE_05635 [Caenorhabditis remanei]|uniref:ATP-dependent DNA helicase n=1 Tax=Caenorhabditis remanei TaxID=31234 RepID=E3M0E3_CAERE|nr:hypothetical protein CRE_05635 [Caenorhabditis remanei]
MARKSKTADEKTEKERNQKRIQREKKKKEEEKIKPAKPKPNLKSMTKEELREYYNVMRRNSREKQKLAAGIPAKFKPNLKSMTEDERRAYNSAHTKKHREKKKLAASAKPPVSDEAEMESIDMKSENGSSMTGQPEIKSINDISMNTVSDFMDIEPNEPVLEPIEPEIESPNEVVPDIEPEHKSRKRNASDAHCFAVPQTLKKTCIKQKDEESIGRDIKKCKVRIGMINIFEVETDAIVVPTYAEKLSKEELNFEIFQRTFKKMTPEKYSIFENSFNNEWEDDLNNYHSRIFNWGVPKEAGSCWKTIHVKPPVVKNDKFTIISEQHLRAAYMSCLLEADKSDACQSLAFPILGHGACFKKSVAIGLQAIFAYMQAVEHTNLQLIYIVTPFDSVYDKLGDFLSYIREFDLTHWLKKDLYFGYEKYLFDKIKTEVHYATIPGTDMIWRCFKLSTHRKKSNETNEGLLKIHNSMLKQTGIETGGFTIYKESRRKGRVLNTKMIKNGAYKEKVVSPHILMNLTFDMNQFCGSNAILRKLWIISYYQIYFQDNSLAVIDLTSSSSAYKLRKRIFDNQKRMHAVLLNEWKKTFNHAPYVCSCTKENGYHENFMVFTTKFSHPDLFNETWLLDRRSFVFSYSDGLSLESIEKYFPTFMYKEDEKFKSEAVRNYEAMNSLLDDRISSWMDVRAEILERQHQRFQNVLSDHNDVMVGNEAILHDYDPLQFDEELDAGRCDDKYRNHLIQHLRDADDAVRENQSSKNLKLQKYWEIALDINRYELHMTRDAEVERCLRNRLFRMDFSDNLEIDYPRLSTMDQDSDQDSENQDSVGEENSDWYIDDQVVSVDVFIVRFLEKMGYAGQMIRPISPVLFTDQKKDWPKLLDIGDRTNLCRFCAAYLFERETKMPCCQAGAVNIPPLKLLPKEIQAIFQKAFKTRVISTNAAFAMASLHMDRQHQAPGGINTMKVKGMVTAHPSALNPKGAPRYANFIVLQCSNKEIAQQRLETLPGKVQKRLEAIFVDIQTYMDKHNGLYQVFKTMKEIEEEFLKDNNYIGYLNNNQMIFRIVSPGELDDDKFKELNAHHGVYARPSRMGDYVAVAYTHDAGKTTMLPKGFDVYPRNPADLKKPLRPITSYSDMCDLMCYPLFFPDGVGGWALRKYKRFVGKKSDRLVYEQRFKKQIEDIEERGEHPEDYFDFDDPSTPIDLRELYRRVKSKSQIEEENENLESDATDMNEIGSDESDILENEDPLRFLSNLYKSPSPLFFRYDDEQILAYGELEDMQNDPTGVETGRQANITRDDRDGEWYARIDRDQREVDIPLLDIDPFGSDDDRNSDSTEEAPYRSRYDDGTDNYNDAPSLSPIHNSESSDNPVNEPSVTDDNANISFADRSFNDDSDNGQNDDAPFNFEGPEADDMDNMDDLDVPSDDEGMNRQSVVNEIDDGNFEDFEMEDVCYGDEHAAESNALGRHNDGRHVKNLGQRTHTSISETVYYNIQDRPGIESRYQGKAGSLGQLWVIDTAFRAKEMRMNAIAYNRLEIPRATNKSAMMKTLAKMVKENYRGLLEIGSLVTIPSSVPGSSKYQRELVMSAVTIANRLGPPDLFITYTGNPEWPEIKRATMMKACKWADIPDIIVRVFDVKSEVYFEDVLGKKKKMSSMNGKVVREVGMFGQVRWHNYSVEFQQRGMPHIHQLVCLEVSITTAEQVDEIISAEVPDFPTDTNSPNYEDDLRYYNLVRDMMTHAPCEHDNDAYCMKDKKSHWRTCTKGFPKQFSDETVLCDNEYPKYRRTRKNVFIFMRKGRRVIAGSDYVVPHSRKLLMKHGCHINVEIVSSLKSIKYVFKYIHKGADRILLEASEKNVKGSKASDSMTLDGCVFVPKNLNQAKVRERQEQAIRTMKAAGVKVTENHIAINDCTYMLDLSAMTAPEAIWRLSGRHMHGSSHIVNQAFIHEENKEPMYTVRGVDAAKAGRMCQEKSKGMMNAWFEANQKPDQITDDISTTDLTLSEMSSYYKFDTKAQKFILRERDYSHRIIGRIQPPQPRFLERTATRILAEAVRGPTCWEDLRSYRGTVYASCLEAARARGLMNGDTEWDLALTEIAELRIPVECRRFFASILLNCAPSDPKNLWTLHWKDLINTNNTWSDAQRIAHALRHIQFLLARHRMELSDFELGKEYDEDNLPNFRPEDDVDNPNIVHLNRNEHKEKGREMFKKLNKKQEEFVTGVLKLVNVVGKSRMVYVGGAGGTGKTFCYKTIHHILMSKKKSVACVSHYGIAACLLPDGCTAHRKFSIPLEVVERMVCKVDAEGSEAAALRLLDCIIWDEVCMTDRRILHAVDDLFRILKGEADIPFGGVLIIMGGDWRQILPIVEGVRGHGVSDYTLKTSTMWDKMTKFELTENQRAINDPEYAKLILHIGNGTNYVDEKRQMVHIPEQFVERAGDKALADWVFPDVNKIEETKTAALLTIDNKTALRMNDFILDKLDGVVRTFFSTDTSDKTTGFTADVSVFQTVTPSGMPPHRLRLKVKAQVVLLRNLSVEQGLCNGTRLTVEAFGNDVIFCSVNTPTSKSPKTVYLHRMIMCPTGNGANSCGFRRLQYPIRLAYACTINKSQGQTLSRCGLLVHSAVFSHGQLYVAMSRVQRAEDFRMWHTKRVTEGYDNIVGGGILVRNVVYRDVLRDEPIKTTLESLKTTADTLLVTRTSPTKSIDSETSDETDMAPKSSKTTKSSKPSTLQRFFKIFNKKPVQKSSDVVSNVGNNSGAAPFAPQRLDLPYLLLDTDGTDCFINTIVNILYNCPEVREKYVNCQHPNMPLGNILGRIFRKETFSAREWRQTLPAEFHTGQQDLVEVFDMLMRALAVEDGTTIQMEHAPETKCRSCDEEPSYGNATASTHIEVQMLEDANFEDLFNDIYEMRHLDTPCTKCSAKDMWTEPRIIINGSQIFVTVIPNMKRFWDLNVNTVVSMFGEFYQFQAFAEYSSSDGGLSGHYQAWVRGEDGMVCISDNKKKHEQYDVDLENYVATLLAFVKI